MKRGAKFLGNNFGIYLLCWLNFIESTQLSYWPQLYSSPDGNNTIINSQISYFVILVDLFILVINYNVIINLIIKKRYIIIMSIISWALLTSITSNDIVASFRGAIKFLVQFLIFVYIISRYDRYFYRSIYIFAIFFSISNMIYILAVPQLGIDTSNSIRFGTWRGMLPYKTQLGEFSAILLFYLYGYRRYMRERAALVDVVTVLLLATLVIGSQSRIAWVGSLIALTTVYILNIINIKSTYRIVLFIIILILIFPISYFLFNFALSFIGRDSTLTGRTELWLYFASELLNKPIFGSGMNVYFADYGNLLRAHYAMGWADFASAHNTYLEWGLSTGVVGAAMAALVSLQAFASGVRNSAEGAWSQATIFLGPVVLVLCGFMLTSNGAVAGFPWIVLFSVIIARNTPKAFSSHR